MGRKNQRRDIYVPLDLTPSDLNSPPVTPAQHEQRRRRSAESDREDALLDLVGDEA